MNVNFTQGADYKNLPPIRLDARRLMNLLFAVTLALIVIAHLL